MQEHWRRSAGVSLMAGSVAPHSMRGFLLHKHQVEHSHRYQKHAKQQRWCEKGPLLVIIVVHKVIKALLVLIGNLETSVCVTCPVLWPSP